MASIQAETRSLVKALQLIQPEIKGRDRSWTFLTPIGSKRKKWHRTFITEYNHTYYFSCPTIPLQWEYSESHAPAGGSNRGQIDDGDPVVVALLGAIRRGIRECRRDWLGFNRKLARAVPLDLRHGTVPRRVVWEVMGDTAYRPDLLLGDRNTQTFVRLTSEGVFRADEKGRHRSMTLGKFLAYCRTAYLANFKEYRRHLNPSMTGLEMYKAMADGRHEGLIDLPPASAEAFEAWHATKYGRGGHPWEICRGGNTTHIDLGVIKRREGWSVFLRGPSTGRMVETCRMGLAMHRRKMPVEIPDAEGMVLKLLGIDNVGIVPTFESARGGSQDFSERDRVYDCIHLSDMGKHKRRLVPLVSWKPLPMSFPA